MLERFHSRIPIPEKDIPTLMSRVAQDYGVGFYKSHNIVPVGYEDYNAVLETDKNKYFVKVFALFRNPANIDRYVATMEKVIEAGVSYPQLLESPTGHVSTVEVNGKTVRLCLMQYIDGKTLYELGIQPTQEERTFLIQQAALINGIDYKPPHAPDSWAIDRFLPEYEIKNKAVELKDQQDIDPIAEDFKKLKVEKLPHAFVHGDIRSTNIMKDKNGKLLIIDFGVSNWYPRIQELAILLCDLMFDADSPEKFKELYEWAVAEYQKYIKLTLDELQALPVYARAAHAINVIGPSWERSQGNTEGENNSWLDLGRKGLELSKQLVI